MGLFRAHKRLSSVLPQTGNRSMLDHGCRLRGHQSQSGATAIADGIPLLVPSIQPAVGHQPRGHHLKPASGGQENRCSVRVRKSKSGVSATMDGYAESR
jgi:hypothetical protein